MQRRNFTATALGLALACGLSVAPAMAQTK